MIDWSKVAVFHNTQYANSQEAAEYYATARGISAGNVQGFAMGTGVIAGTTNATRDTFRNGVLTDMRDFCTANGIEMVVLSICCPRRYGHNPEYVLQQGEFDPYKYSAFCGAISDADRIVTLGGAQAAEKLLNVGNFYLNFGGAKTALAMRLRSGGNLATDSGTPIFDWRGSTLTANYKHVFCGRLGYATSALADDSVALAKRCVDDAIWYEANGNPQTSPVMFGMSTRVTLLEHGNVYSAWRSAVNTGIRNTLSYNGNHDGEASSKWAADDWGYPEPEWSISDTPAWLHGDGPVKDIWGCVGTGMENNAGDIIQMPVTSANIQRGAWVFESTSDNTSGQCIPHGLTAAICPVQEPYAVGVPEISGLVQYLLMGFSITEAADMSSKYFQAISYEAWGDPLYKPFNNFRFGCAGQGMGMQ